jgi:hypothetical protein
MDGDTMPEKLTKEEALISKTIETARIVKELIQQENEVMLPYDDDSEVVKVKRPKAQSTKVTNQGSDENGFGSAGETFGKAERDFPIERRGTKSEMGVLRAVKGIHFPTAVEYLRKGNKERLTAQQVQNIEREIAKLQSMPKEELYTIVALSNALGLPLYP